MEVLDILFSSMSLRVNFFGCRLMVLLVVLQSAQDHYLVDVDVGQEIFETDSSQIYKI